MTTTDDDTSKRNAGNRRRGKTAEGLVANYLREHGWPHAKRAQRTGFSVPGREVADPGDLAGCPGLIWSIKDTQVERFPRWWKELDAMGEPEDQVGGLRILVVKRRGYGSPGQWWCWIRLIELHYLLCGAPDAVGLNPPVRLTLGDLVTLLRHSGYVEEASA